MKRLFALAIAAIAVFSLTFSAPALASNTRLDDSSGRHALATTWTLNPVADTYVQSSNPSTNYGSATQTRVDGLPVVRAYLRFSVVGVTGAVSRVTLRIYANSSLNTGITANRVADNLWNESAVNYANAPAVGAGIGTSSAVAAGSWLSIDVTPYVNGNGTYSFALTSTNVTALSLASREAANKPQLIVTTATSATPTPLSPTATTVPPTATRVPPTASKALPTATRVPPTATPGGTSGSVTLTPVADAYVQSSYPSTNYGTSSQIRLDGSPIVRSYLRFNVAGLSSAVSKATLRLYANSNLDTGIVANRVTSNTWGEMTINYGNAPAVGTAIGTTAAASAGAWISVDVTSYVTGNGTYSFALIGTNVTALSLASREAVNKPQLVIQTGSGTLPTTTATKASPTPTRTPGSSADPIIFFNGDLVSSSSLARAQKVVALIKNLMAQHTGTPMLVASTGDNEQENTPTLSAYQNYFGATYGTFFRQGIFRPVRGNHDTQDAGHGAAYAQYFGNPPLNHSYDLGAWHLIGLDQVSSSVSSAALNFLKSDLAAHAGTKCQIAYWHVPTYSSGSAHGDATGLKSLNQAEYDAGVDIQINGHDHDYQRFYPLAPDGKRDDARGITTFIDGIGGQNGRSGSRTSIAQAASARYFDTFPGGDGDHAIGVIMFTLHADSADYALYNANNGAVLDQGTVFCH